MIKVKELLQTNLWPKELRETFNRESFVNEYIVNHPPEIMDTRNMIAERIILDNAVNNARNSRAFHTSFMFTLV